MTVNFYHTEDDPKKVDKTLTLFGTVTCNNVNDVIDVAAPRLKLVYDPNYLNSSINYAYIADFGKYYFVGEPEIDGKIVYLPLKIDRLMTFKDQIKALRCTVERTSEPGKADGYLMDSEYQAKSYTEIKTFDFPVSLDNFSTIIMTV